MSIVNKPTDLRDFDPTSEIDRGLLKIIARDLKKMMMHAPAELSGFIERLVSDRAIFITEEDIESGDKKHMFKVVVSIGPMATKTLAKFEIAGVDQEDHLWLRVEGIYVKAIEVIQRHKETSESVKKALDSSDLGDIINNMGSPPDDVPGDEWKKGDN